SRPGRTGIRRQPRPGERTGSSVRQLLRRAPAAARGGSGTGWGDPQIVRRGREPLTTYGAEEARGSDGDLMLGRGGGEGGATERFARPRSIRFRPLAAGPGLAGFVCEHR